MLEVITRSRHKARENVHGRATIGFGFTSDWLKKWRENFEPITEWSNHKQKQFANFFRNSIENHFIEVLGGVYMIPGWLSHQREFTPVPSLSSVLVQSHNITEKCHAVATHTGASSPRLLHESEKFFRARNLATVSCKRGTATLSVVKSTSRWAGTGSACVLFLSKSIYLQFGFTPVFYQHLVSLHVNMIRIT